MMSQPLAAESKLKREESRGVCCVEREKEGRVAVESTSLVEGGYIDCGRQGISYIFAHMFNCSPVNWCLKLKVAEWQWCQLSPLDMVCTGHLGEVMEQQDSQVHNVGSFIYSNHPKTGHLSTGTIWFPDK
jgi:hypothetical protein